MEIDITSLIRFHNQEIAEGYSTISAFSLAILAFLGALKGKLALSIRIAIILGFMLFATFNYNSLRDSFRMHEAIHLEIKHVLSENENLIKTKDLKEIFMFRPSYPEYIIIFPYLFFDLIVIISLLLIGEGSLRDYINKRKLPK